MKVKNFMALAIIVIIAIIMFFVIYEEGLYGTYENENGYYTIKFTSSSKCTWYQDDTFFYGNYKKTDNNKYELVIEGSGIYMDTHFIVEMSGKDLIITGGDIYKEWFIKK